MTSCAPWAIAKIAGVPVKAVEVMLKTMARKLTEDDPDQDRITILDDDRIGVIRDAVECCLGYFGFEVRWVPVEDTTLAAVRGDLPQDQWVILWIESPFPNHKGQSCCHTAAYMNNKTFDTYANGLLPEAHPYADQPVIWFGFVTQYDDDEDEMKDAA